MARKSKGFKREIQPDPKFNDLMVAKFINIMMVCGKRSVAERMFYGAIDVVTEKGGGEEGVKLFKKAIENCKPMLEVKSRRVGGATYQVPVEVKPMRRQSLASRWIIEGAHGRGEHSFQEKLAAEILDAASNRGNAIKKREDTHRMAEANKAFAHFRW